MANKSYLDWSVVNAGTQDVHSFPVLASGERWVITKMGGCDIRTTGENASSVYVLQWGSTGSWETVRLISLSGNTIEYEIGREFEGDGVKSFRLIRINKSATNNRELPVWLDAYSRE
jgi:hypothetical protein